MMQSPTLVRPVTLTLFLIFAALGLALPSAMATVAVSPLYGSNMVIQRDKPFPVRGTSAANRTITITFNGQTTNTTSDATGNWQVALPAMSAKALGGNFTITEASGNTITLGNVVVGDVWLCSGQSNMGIDVNYCNQPADVSSANFPGIRYFGVPLNNLPSVSSAFNGSVSWSICSPTTVGGYSAAAFYFARTIYTNQNGTVPIGLEVSAVGGTRIDPWLGPEGLTDIPLLAPLYSQSSLNFGTFSLFNGMIYPLAPCPIRGVLWYQGENSEATTQSVDSYYLKEKALISGWKRMLGEGDCAFYLVQIANWGTQPSSPAPVLLCGGWDADTRLQQGNAINLPHAGVASAIDIGDSSTGNNIWLGWHPTNKWDVGFRLALWAMKNEYGQTNLVTSGPVLRDVTVSGSTATCTFDSAGSGLMVGYKPVYGTAYATNSPLALFSIAGADGTWYWATATITGSNKVVLSSPSVTTPKMVSYACWQNPAGVNLYNSNGLPALPFHVPDVAAKYTVTASAGASGRISPAGAATYLKRMTALYTIKPDPGYYIQDVQVDGVSVGSVSYYTFDPLYANHTISATFGVTAPTYTITASGNASGAPNPSGLVNVTQGGSQAFNMVANANCRLISVTLDGAPLGSRNSVILPDVRTTHTVSAFFAPIPAPGAGTGLRGDYYAGANFEVFRVSRTDVNINFDWQYGSPDTAIPMDGFSARWTGQIQPQFTETYTFYLTHDDGARLWVNNQLVIDNWGGSGGTDSGSISLTNGQKVAIKLEYFENLNTANCKLEWYSPSLPREVVPTTQLFPATTPIYTVTASAGSGGSLNPSGTVLANSGSNQVFTVIPSVGYFISDVKTDNVSQGPIGAFTFTNITANHTISATFTALPSYGVSGRVTRQGLGTAIPGATVGFYPALSVVGNPSYSATTDASGNYNVSVPAGTWYARALAPNYFTSAAQTVVLISAPVTNISFALAASTRNIPRTTNLLFSAVTDSFPASGNTGSWTSYLPSGQTFTPIGSPAVQTLNGVKWETNVYTDGDGFSQGTYTSPIACNGVSLIAAVQPNYISVGGEVRGEIVDFFYSDLFLAVNHGTGEVIVDYRGYFAINTGYLIPNGQITILSLVVQPNGSMTLYANGVQKWTYATGVNYTSLQQSGLGGAAQTITIGRNAYDGWSTFSGGIGDVFVYTNALAAADRQQLEADLTSKFITGGATNYPITATAGAGGAISPSGTTLVNPGATQAFTITPGIGYAVSNVTADALSKGAITSFTFANVTASHSISASFKPLTFTITASAGANGSISPTGAQTLNYGTTQAFTMTPNTGYQVASVTVDGANQGSLTSYTFTNVTANHTISAAFASATPPTLSFSRNGTGGIDITWPDTYSGALLTSPVLGPGASWTPAGAATHEGLVYKFTVAPTNSAAFYGLSQ